MARVRLTVKQAVERCHFFMGGFALNLFDGILEDAAVHTGPVAAATTSDFLTLVVGGLPGHLRLFGAVGGVAGAAGDAGAGRCLFARLFPLFVASAG
jgi:hypothetical protein